MNNYIFAQIIFDILVFVALSPASVCSFEVLISSIFIYIYKGF